MNKWSDKVQAVISGKQWLDFTAFGVNKGNAIKAIQEKLGIDKTECIAFGDNYNDIEMFEAVGRSFGMSSAVEDIQRRCTDITDCVETELDRILQEM